jgi:hypothetical protein
MNELATITAVKNTGDLGEQVRLENRVGELERKRAALVPEKLDQPYVYAMIRRRLEKAAEVVLAQARDVAQQEQKNRAEAEEMLRLIRALENYEETGNPKQGEYRFVER